MQPTVIHSRHPLLPSADRSLYTAAHIPGESVADLLARVGVPLGELRPVVVQVNGVPLTQTDLHVRLVGESDIVTVRDAVEGGDGSNVLAIVALVALTVFTYGAGGATLAGLSGLTGTGLVVAQTAVMIGGQLLIQQLFPPKVPKAQNVDQSPTYSLNGGANAARPYSPLPLVMGSLRVFRDIASKPFVEFQGDDQMLYQVFNFGLSPSMALTDVQIGDTPIENFSDVLVQTVTGDNGSHRAPWTQTLCPGNVDTIEGGGELSYGHTLTKVSSLNTTALAIDLVGSLFRTNKKGEFEDEEVVLQAQFRKIGTSTWYDFNKTSPWSQSITYRYTGFKSERIIQSLVGYVISNDSTKPVRRSLYRGDLEVGQYEVRVTKLNFDVPEKGEIGYDEDQDSKRTSQLAWSQLRSYQVDPATYPDQTRLAVSIRASGQINGTIERLSAIATPQIPVWDSEDEEWVTQATSNPAWWYLWFARGHRDANGRKVYGACLPDSSIDINGLVEWAAWCDAMDLSFNWVCDTHASVHDVLATIARVGRGIPSLATGKLGVIYDRADLPVTQMFGMANIRAGSFSVDYVSENLADEVVVEFINPDLGWQQDTVRALVPGVTNPTKSVSYQIAGITDADQAGREANLQAAAQILFNKRVSFESDIEGLVCSKGDIISISHDLTSWSASGRLAEGSTASTLHLSRPVVFGSSGSTPYVQVRLPDGTIVVRAVASQADGTETSTITLTAPLPVNPSADPTNGVADYLFSFNPLEIPGKRFKIVHLEPLSENHVRIVAREESEAYYEAEDGDYTYVAPTLLNLGGPSITNVRVTEQLVDQTGETVQIHVAWDLKGAESTMLRVAGSGEQYTNLGTINASATTFLWYRRDTITIELTPVSVVRLKDAPGVTTLQYTIRGSASHPEDVAWQVPNVNGLELFGDEDQSLVFTGADAKFIWRRVASRATEIGSELQGADSGQSDSWFRDYEVTVLDLNGSVRRVERVTDETYVYTFEKNFEDGLGTPARSFTVEVRARGSQNQLSARAARLTVSNPAPEVPAGISTSGALTTGVVRFSPPLATDFAGVLVWASTSSGFTPGSDNLVSDTSNSTVILPDLESGVTYFVRIAAYDLFGKTDLNVSSELSLTTHRVGLEDLAEEVQEALSGDVDISEELEELQELLESQIDGIATDLSNATADLVDALAAETGARTSAITSEQTARISADTAIAAELTVLAAVVDDNGDDIADAVAAIASEASTRASADTALAADITTLTSTVGGHTSSISTISGTMSTLSGTVSTLGSTVSSHTSSISGLTSTTGTHTSQISTLSSDLSSAASSISTLSSTVGGHTSTLSTLGSSIDGINAKYGVKIDNNGYVSGYGLISTANNGTPTSMFAVLADRFAIFNGSTATNPFTVSGGVVYMTNAVANNIAAGAVTADKLAVTSLDSITATIGLLRTASSGARLEIESNQVRVYDSGGTMRVRMGIW